MVENRYADSGPEFFHAQTIEVSETDRTRFELKFRGLVNSKIIVEYKSDLETQNVTPGGIGQCAVVVDGGWSHRSYGHKYTSTSEISCIIGVHTKKLLFVRIRNTYCGICAINERKQTTTSTHTCYKNWTGSSPAMEADIRIEGFLKSESIHNLQYRTFIGDGDSSVHSKILEKVPYTRKIRKIECANHLTKYMTKNFHEMAKEPATNKKLLSSARINFIGHFCRKLISIYARKDNPCVENLKTDLLNVINHVFGDHEYCKQE
uniref:Uncharacterized protein LOC114341435 n=1 Tax=Diabrotica virgifera virgifera TaxID=50390 RepID=A0A6P7GEL7_DIAVI